MRAAVKEDLGWPDKWCNHSWWPEFGCGRRYCNIVKQHICMNCKERRYLPKCPHDDPGCQMRAA